MKEAMERQEKKVVKQPKEPVSLVKSPAAPEDIDQSINDVSARPLIQQKAVKSSY